MRVLVLKKTEETTAFWIDALRRAGHDLRCCSADREAELLSALEEEWDLILSDDDLISAIDRLRRLVAHQRSVHEAQSAAVARTLHDEVAQSLTSLKIDLARLGRKLDNVHLDSSEEITSMGREIDRAFCTVREIMSQCKPGVPENFDLQDMIEWRAREFEIRSPIGCIVLLEQEPIEVDRNISTALAGILDEALSNVARHSNAREVTIRLNLEGANIVMSVEDDGRGISEDEIADGESLGLFQMRELALGMKGTVVLNAERGGGTIVKAFIPMEDQAVTPSPEREMTK